MFRLGIRNIYIWPSREGGIYLIGLLTIFLCAVNFNNALIYALSFLLIGLFLVCLLYTYSNIYGLCLHITPAAPVFVDEYAVFTVRALSPTGTRSLLLPSTTGPVHLQAQVERHLELRVPARQRGWLPLGTVRVSTQYPAGLFRAWTLLPGGVRGLVYPRPEPPRHAPAQQLVEEEHALSNPLHVQTGANDFQGFRTYQPGDPPRSIAWKSLRSDTLLINRFSDPAQSRLVLDWHALTGDPETRLSQLCSWVLQAEQSQNSYALRLPGNNIATGTGVAHKQTCLQALALYD